MTTSQGTLMSADNPQPDHAPQPPCAWDRREDETDKSWYAFCLYRDLSPHERSLFAVSEALYGDDEEGETCSEPAQNRPRMAPSWVREWSARHAWVERARAHDDHIAEQTRQLKMDARVRAEKILWDALEEVARAAVKGATQGGVLSPEVALIRDLLDRGEVGSPTRVAHSIASAQDVRALFGIDSPNTGDDE